MKEYLQAHFCSQDGSIYAGSHLILDIWDAKYLDDTTVIEQAFSDAIEACGATLLHMHFHPFGEEQGVSGIAVLQESHISCHTFPEVGYASFDVYLCGKLDPLKSVEIFKKAFESTNVEVRLIKRGIVTPTLPIDYSI